MKTDDYIQTIRATLYVLPQLPNLLNVAKDIDDIRKLHDKFQNECEYLLLDSLTFDKIETKQKINEHATKIIDYCKNRKIVCVFVKMPREYTLFAQTFHDEKQFVKYYYNNVDITNLIVYVKRKKILVEKKPENVLQNVTLDEQMFYGDSFIKSDRNKLPNE